MNHLIPQERKNVIVRGGVVGREARIVFAADRVPDYTAVRGNRGQKG